MAQPLMFEVSDGVGYAVSALQSKCVVGCFAVGVFAFDEDAAFGFLYHALDVADGGDGCAVDFGDDEAFAYSCAEEFAAIDFGYLNTVVDVVFFKVVFGEFLKRCTEHFERRGFLYLHCVF